MRLHDRTIDDAQVRRAIEAIGADRFVDALPRGLDTQVGERGRALSTGQKQLLAFARALAFDPPVLVLDEATSSVDSESERLIESAVARLLAGRTSVVIAHRLATIRRVDRIVVIHHGEVRETGTHAELLAADGLYARLYQLQFADQRAADAARTAGAVSAAIDTALEALRPPPRPRPAPGCMGRRRRGGRGSPRLTGAVSETDALSELETLARDVGARVDVDLSRPPSRRGDPRDRPPEPRAPASQPRHGAELVSQMLLGEEALVLRERGGWLQVQTGDRYVAWVHHRSLDRRVPDDPAEFRGSSSAPSRSVMDRPPRSARGPSPERSYAPP